MIKESKSYILLRGDFIAAGLYRYPDVWNEYLASTKNSVLNLGIGAGRIENVPWEAIDVPLPLSVKNNSVILCETNNIPIDTFFCVADWINNIDSILVKKSIGINVSVYGLTYFLLYFKTVGGLSPMVHLIVVCSIKVYHTS